MDTRRSNKVKHKYTKVNKVERKRYTKRLYQTPVQKDNRNDLIPVRVVEVPNRYDHSYYSWPFYKDAKLKEKQLSNIHSANARRKHAPYAKSRTLRYTDDMLHSKRNNTNKMTIRDIFITNRY